MLRLESRLLLWHFYAVVVFISANSAVRIPSLLQSLCKQKIINYLILIRSLIYCCANCKWHLSVHLHYSFMSHIRSPTHTHTPCGLLNTLSYLETLIHAIVWKSTITGHWVAVLWVGYMLSLLRGKAEEQWEMLIRRQKDDERLDIYRQYCYHEQTIRESSPYPEQTGCHMQNLLTFHVTTFAILYWNTSYCMLMVNIRCGT